MPGVPQRWSGLVETATGEHELGEVLSQAQGDGRCCPMPRWCVAGRHQVLLVFPGGTLNGAGPGFSGPALFGVVDQFSAESWELWKASQAV